MKRRFFSGLRIIGKNTQHELHIAGVRRSQAIKAKEIIEGLLFEDANGIEVPYWIQSDVRRGRLAEAGRNPDHGEDLHVRGYLT